MTININGSIIHSTKSMNVLGVQFDAQLNWTEHINRITSKAIRSLHAIRLIRRFFNKSELLQLITSNFYSILYYNSEIWLIPSLNAVSKQKLLSASANALKLCSMSNPQDTSYISLHTMCNRAIPEKIMLYKHAIELYKLYNTQTVTAEWTNLNFQQNFNGRVNKFLISSTSQTKVGKNILTNRLVCINNKISLDWLNLSLTAFKLKCKSLFLK